MHIINQILGWFLCELWYNVLVCCPAKPYDRHPSWYPVSDYSETRHCADLLLS